MLKEVDTKEFEELMGEGLVLADFFSVTCGPCKMLSFVLRDVEKEHPEIKILKIDFDQNKELTEKYDVNSYPTIILFKDGQEVSRKQGLQQKPVIVKMVEEQLQCQE